MRVVVRADTSSKIGTGHAMRACAIFDRLHHDGDDVLFICREAEGHIAETIKNRGYEVCFIPDIEDFETDAHETIGILSERDEFDCLWVDHYGLDARWEKLVRPFAKRIAVIDDLADRPHEVDLLVDPSHSSDEGYLYDGLLNCDAIRLVGYEYVPLRQEFLDYAPNPNPSLCSPARHLLITLGGNDPLNATGFLLTVLEDPRFDDLTVNVTVGTSNPRLPKILRRAERMDRVTVHVQHEKPSKLMHWADLCIGAGGVTAWERCYMGLPTIGVVLAENQMQFMNMLESKGAIHNLGWADKIDLDCCRDFLHDCILDVQWREQSSKIGMQLFDGKGAERILNTIINQTVEF